MRKPVPLPIPPYLVSDARLYAPGRSDLDAVCYLLQDYPRLVREVRQLTRQLDDFNRESAELDQLAEQLKAICGRIMDL